MNIGEMTGLEIKQAIVREKLPHLTMTTSILVKVIKVEKEERWFSMLSQIISILTLNVVFKEICFNGS